MAHKSLKRGKGKLAAKQNHMATSAKSISIPQIFGVSALCAAIIIAFVAVYSGLDAIFPIMVLALLEMTFSFDNAVLNSQVLSRMSRLWQQLFLTVGIAIAVFGVRLFLPIVLVAATTGNTMRKVLDLALNHPEEYAHNLEAGYPIIAAFGGVFLLMIGLRFFGENRKVRWLNTVEGPLGEFNQPWWLVAAGAVTASLAVGLFLAPGQKGPFIGAILGALSFVFIKGLGEFMVYRRLKKDKDKISTGWHALTLFLYLELLDGSFSFDGVVAAFAITKDIVLIAAGLGIGALFVRSMTIYLLQSGTINKFRYLLHGAHYAVLMLGLLLLTSVRFHLPEMITGTVGIFIIVSALLSSHIYEKRTLLNLSS